LHQLLEDTFQILTFWFGHKFVFGHVSKLKHTYYDSIWQTKWFNKESKVEQNALDQQIKALFVDTGILERYLKIFHEENNNNNNNNCSTTTPKTTTTKTTIQHNDSSCGFINPSLELLHLSNQWTMWLSNGAVLLAMIVLYDQIPRNVFRNTSKAYAFDIYSLKLCLWGMQQELQQQQQQQSELDKVNVIDQLPDFALIQYLMPLIHSENRDHQSLVQQFFQRIYSRNSEVAFFKRILQISAVHKRSIEIFGRFPERNQYLNRPSTPQEIAYLSSTQVLK